MVQPDSILTTGRTGASAVVSVRGELDAHSAPNVDAEVARLLADGVTDLVFDLSATSFLDSFGLRALLAAESAAAAQGARFALDAPSKPVQRLLDIAGLADHFAGES